VYIQCSAATPLVLVDAMTQHGILSKLKDVELIHMHTQGPAEYAKPHCQGRTQCVLSLYTLLSTHSCHRARTI